MKKTATLIALAGLSMAAKTEHSFLGRKPVEISSEIDPKMIIKPAHDIDPGMVRKPHKNIDQGIFVKPKKTQGTILTADDNDDELLLIYRPADNIDPGMVRRPPFGSEIDPKFVIKPPRNIDNGIFVRPQLRDKTVWVDDEMRVVSGTEVDPGMVIKPKRGDIDPGMVRKPVKGWEIDPKIFVKPKRGDVLYADDDELAVFGGKIKQVSDQGIPNGKSHDDELMYQRFPTAVSDLGIPARSMGRARDDEFVVVANKTKQVREPRLIGDFPINWPGQPVYADDADDELAFVRISGTASVSDPIIHGGHTRDDEFAQMSAFVREPRIIGDHGKSADDELVYASSRIDLGMVRRPPFETIDQGMIRRPRSDIKYFDAENDEELAIVREPRLIGDFYTKPWPGQPIYADAEDNELIMFADHSLDRPRRGVFDPRELTKPWYQQQQTMYADDADHELLWYRKAEDKKDNGKIQSHKLNGFNGEPKNLEKIPPHRVNDLKTGRAASQIKPATKPMKPVKEADDELIMFADKSLDARLERRKVPIDLKELTKPWYQQQHTMYADDSLVALGELLEDN